MSTPNSDSKSSRKWWWIIMILPIGIIIGSITSIISHLNQSEAKEEQQQYKVAVALNAKDIQIAMERSLLLGKRKLSSDNGRRNIQAVRRFIEGSVSPGGAGLQFPEITTRTDDNKSIKLSYTDIVGTQPNSLVVVVIELVGDKGKADAAKLGLTPSLIRSLVEEKPLHTIRFVLTPHTRSAAEHANTLSIDGKTLHKLIVLKEQPEAKLTDPTDWKLLHSSPIAFASNSNEKLLEITHPVLCHSAETHLSPEFYNATLHATQQLRTLLLQLAN